MVQENRLWEGGAMRLLHAQLEQDYYDIFTRSNKVEKLSARAASIP
jgi:hypothetical protein